MKSTLDGDMIDDGGHQKSWKNNACVTFLRNNVLLFLLIISLGLGVLLGAVLKMSDKEFTDRDLMYLGFPGDLLMRMLKMLIIPLIVSSLVSGLAGLDAKASGKMGLRALVYYLSTTFMAVVLGIILVVSMKPGESDNVESDETEETDPGNIADSFLDLIRNMFPDNIVEACIRQTKTFQVEIEEEAPEMDNMTTLMPDMTTMMNGSMEEEDPEYYPDVRKMNGMNVLGLVVYSVAMGIILSKMGDVGRPLYKVFLALSEATMIMVSIVIWYSPIGIMFLVAREIIKMDDPIEELRALGMYMATVLTGLFIHGFFVLPLCFFLITRKNPIKYIYGVLQAIVTAFGTASSSATLPVTYRCLEDNLGIDKRVTRFVLPVGATINMDGTALYEAVAAIFIAQTNDKKLNAAEIVAASITSTLASIGAASVPQAGLVTMVIVLTALGLPPNDVTKILAVDWLLDRFRTAINVLGDSFGAGIVAHLSRKELGETPPAEDLDHELQDPEGLKKPNNNYNDDLNGGVVVVGGGGANQSYHNTGF